MNWKNILIALGLIVVLAAGIGYSIINKPHKNITKAESDFVVTAPKLLQDFKDNEAEANKKYLDKVVKVKGAIQSVSKEEGGMYSVMLATGDPMSGVSCTIEQQQENNFNYQSGDSITLKGVCTGMLMDVVLVRCVVAE
ncbi:MAG: OB-fold putative lipoprotein [Hymenobacteraceae bacterium]|nr:OB-fold putative lipoprotein [Hymenobacteraceae bacterium]MDX5397657.1 OB-fold putative lipoprotein [Hymenobacteraceae bacterium]MDX5513734.1 OB-fold putative lipoprotein [Hymenobacteraceae bacterium]